MALTDLKLTEADFKGKGADALPAIADAQGVIKNKKDLLIEKLDELAKMLGLEYFNALIDNLAASTAASELGAEAPTGFEGTDIQSVLESMADYIINLQLESGSGDMLKLIYDTGNKQQDIFAYADAISAALQSAINGKAASSHTHAVADVANLQSTLNSKASASHSHGVSDVTGLQSALDGKAATSHTHTIANITNLQTTLNSKAAASHTHSIANVSGLQDALNGKLSTSKIIYSSSTPSYVSGGIWLKPI